MQLSTVHGSPSSQPPEHRGRGLTVVGGSVVGGVVPEGSVVVVVATGPLAGGPDRKRLLPVAPAEAVPEAWGSIASAVTALGFPVTSVGKPPAFATHVAPASVLAYTPRAVPA